MKTLGRNFLLSIYAIFAFLSPLAAQPENPVHWTAKAVHAEGNAYRVEITARIDKPWHLYDLGPYRENGGPNETVFTFEPNPSVELVGAPYQVTKPVRVKDETFGMEIGYFAGEARFAQDVRLKGGIAGARLSFNVEWMVCNDENCLPPADEDLSVVIGDAGAALATSGETAIADETVVSSGNDSISDFSEAAGADEASGLSLWSMIVQAILWGFAALLTPCVFPMVPMTVSFFMKNNDTPARGRFMAALYGFCIVALYTLPIAVIILITKLVGGEAVTADIFNWLATHWVPNVIFFLVFMIFAASFFGAFEITLPGWMVNKSDSKADKGGLLGVFFMALTLVLVSFSCTGPIVGTVLIKSTAGEIWTPVVTMLAFSIAFALPFTLFAFFPSLLSRMPKSGGWLNSVKVVLGFLELALGLKFLSVADQTYHWGILDREIYLAFWIVIFALLGFYLLGKIRFAHDNKSETIGVPRLFLSVVTFTFVVYMIPGMWGAPLKGLSGYLPPMHTQDFVIGASAPAVESGSSESGRVRYGDFLSLPHGLKGFFDYEEAAAYAREVGKPVFLDYTGHGCVNCREMEARVWSDPEVLDMLRNRFVVLALYSDDKKTLPEEDWVTTDTGKVLKGLGKINAYFAHRRYGINSQPYYLILDPADGSPLLPGRGYDLNVENFKKFLQEGIERFVARP